MVKQILFIFSLVLVIQSSNAQKWDNTYGGNYTEEYFEDVIESYDKGYLISGGNDVWPYPTLLLKTDINGAVLWEKTIQHNQLDVYKGQISQNKFGEIVIASTMWDDSNDNWPFIMKIGACGNKQWCRVYIDDFYESGVFNDVILFDNGDVLALCHSIHYYYAYDEIFLYYINHEGDLLWKKSYASKEDYPLMISQSAEKLYEINNGYMIVGDCHYAYPWNPTVGSIRPLFIRLDEDFKELWILPFGVSSNLVSYGTDGMVQLSDSSYMGSAWNTDETLLVFFNDDGEELGYNFIHNEDIGPDIEKNVTGDIARINDSLFITSTVFVTENYGNPFGELIIDKEGHVHNFVSRPNTGGISALVNTFDNKYVIGCTYEYPYGLNDRDIYLYKINDSLQQDTAYTANYVYDSLCPFQIESGEIDISDCLLITDVEEVPTLEVYFESLNTVSIKAYPNPVDEGKVTFEYINMEYLFGSPPSTPPDGGNYPTLQIFNLFGQKVHEERIYQYQGESKVDVSGWGKGMYVGIVVSEGKPLSRCKFVVQ